MDAAAIWQDVKRQWGPHWDFIWLPGNTAAELDHVENTLNVKLPASVRAAMAVCGGAGFPSGSWAPESTLYPISQWRNVRGDHLNDFMSIPECAHDGFVRFLNWGDKEFQDHIVIGACALSSPEPEMVYTLYIEGSLDFVPVGTFTEWLATCRLSKEEWAEVIEDTLFECVRDIRQIRNKLLPPNCDCYRGPDVWNEERAAKFEDALLVEFPELINEALASGATMEEGEDDDDGEE